MKVKEVIKYQKDLEQKYFIFVDKGTLKKVIIELQAFEQIRSSMAYDHKLDIIANYLIHIVNRYKYKYA